MKKYIKCVIEEVRLIKESGEVYAKIKPIGHPKSFIVFFPDGEERYKMKKKDLLMINLWSFISPKMSNDHKKIVKIVNGHLGDYNGPIVKELEHYFLVDASLPILVDKEPNIKVGDYVTGGAVHTIQARIVKNQMKKQVSLPENIKKHRR